MECVVKDCVSTKIQARGMCNAHLAMDYRARKEPQSNLPKSVCSMNGCSTIVSIYNKDPKRRCFQHQDDSAMTVSDALMM